MTRSLGLHLLKPWPTTRLRWSTWQLTGPQRLSCHKLCQSTFFGKRLGLSESNLSILSKVKIRISDVARLSFRFFYQSIEKRSAHKSVSVLFLKPEQVTEFRRLLALEPDYAQCQVDCWGLKRLFSHGLRRWLTGAKGPREP